MATQDSFSRTGSPALEICNYASTLTSRMEVQVFRTRSRKAPPAFTPYQDLGEIFTDRVFGENIETKAPMPQYLRFYHDSERCWQIPKGLDAPNLM